MHLLQVVIEVTTWLVVSGNVIEVLILKNFLQLKDVRAAFICYFSHDIKLLEHLIVSCVYLIYHLLLDDLDCSFDIRVFVST